MTWCAQNIAYLIEFVTMANKNACSHGVYADVPRLSNRKGSEMSMKPRVMSQVGHNLEKVLKHYRVWLDLYHEAYPSIQCDANVQRYGVLLLSDLSKNQIWMLRNKIVPTVNDMKRRDVSNLQTRVHSQESARIWELEEDEDLFRVREKASLWLDGEYLGISARCAHKKFAAWRDASKIRAGDWSSFFAQVPKHAMDRDTFVQLGRMMHGDERVRPFPYTCVGEAIVDFLRLGKLTYSLDPVAICDIAHSDKYADVEAHRQELQSTVGEPELKRTINTHMLTLKDMLSSDEASFANLIVNNPMQPITNILFCNDDGNIEEVAFETADDFYILKFSRF